MISCCTLLLNRFGVLDWLIIHYFFFLVTNISIYKNIIFNGIGKREKYSFNSLKYAKQLFHFFCALINIQLNKTDFAFSTLRTTTKNKNQIHEHFQKKTSIINMQKINGLISKYMYVRMGKCH